MTGIVERVVGLFVAPATGPAPASADAARARVRAATVTIVGGPEAAGAAASVARGLARAGRAPYAMAGVWGGTVRAAGPALPAAATAAARLRERGHDARAHGRVVHVVVADGAELDRCAAACDGVPVVVGLCGARDAAWEARLGGCDAVLVSARGDALLAEVACARVRASHPAPTVSAITVPPRLGPVQPGGAALVRPVLEALT